jgi:hypothetical protein
VPKGVKLIDTTWAMKEKSSGTLRGRVNVRGFKQINRQHYTGTSISVLVTNAMTIRIALHIFCLGKLRMARRFTSRYHWDLRSSTHAILFSCK